jgi:hypothetical protein
MTEDFLHFVWRTRSFALRDLSTTDGVPVHILDTGTWNTGAGPDFSMGRIRLDGTEWVGNIEIHLRASDWERHGHSSDGAYANVILHVVLEDDQPVFIAGRKLPCLELRRYIDKGLVGRYARLVAQATWVPCAGQIDLVSSMIREAWLERMLIERMQIKASRITGLLEEVMSHWEVALYRSLAIAYGFKINAGPFERLARLVPLAVVYKHQDSREQIEALYFGAAGMLNEIFADPYPARLQEEFRHLGMKYQLGTIGAHSWKWGRLRPANFPTIRIAQFAALMMNFQGLFRALLEATTLSTLRELFTPAVSAYWHTHYRFDRPVPSRSHGMGPASIDGLLINTVIPFLFCYGTTRNDASYVSRAVDLMAAMPPEQNTITRSWAKIGMPNAHAAHSQGLIHLKTSYCDHKRCVECAIGSQILTTTCK